MALHNKVGIEGEQMAENWLKENGFILLHRNWRHAHFEIDIIAQKGRTLHFIEVKTRSSNARGYPEESVTRKKFKHLQKAADGYLHLHPGNKWIQFDILAITLCTGGAPQYFLLQDVFL